MGDDGRLPGSVDFFVSYTSADRPWAEWIAWELEAAGYSTLLQAWDMRPGSNFVLEMHRAAQAGERTLVVLSPAFLESGYGGAEWAAAFVADPTGEQRKLVPVRVRDCEPRGLLKAVVYVDVVGLSEPASRDALLAGVRMRRAKPPDAPGFPGREARAPDGKRVRRPEDGAAIFSVPVRTRTFVGRARALEQLEENLTGQGSAAITQVHAIHGLGGVGKTQLAARYARLHRGDYDVIWWLRAEQVVTLRADLASLAVALGLVSVDADEHDAIDAARNWLERNGRWLLIFDNASGPDVVADLIPEHGGGHVVITSRMHADWRALGALPLALDAWEDVEALEFLATRTGEPGSPAAEAVAVALGNLPLALEQAAAYANRQAITLAVYLQRLQDRAPELFSVGRPHGYEHTVETVWSMAYEQVGLSPVARDLLGVCAHLAPEPIPRDLLDAWASTPDRAETTAAGVREAIELLLSYALLTSANGMTVTMHRLTAELARDRASPSERRTAAADAVELLIYVLPEQPSDHQQWSACARLLAHALVATSYASALDAAPAYTAGVLSRVGQYQQARGDYAAARSVMQRALAIFEGTLGHEHILVAITLGNLGITLWRLGDLAAARDAQQRALAITEAIYGPEHAEIAITLTNLGIVLEQLGDLEEARDA